MLKSWRTGNRQPVDLPLVIGHEHVYRKYVDIEFCKADILTNFHASVDVFNLNKRHYYIGDVNTRDRHEFVRYRRASFHGSRISEKIMHNFLNCTLRTIQLDHKRYIGYRKDLESYFSPSVSNNSRKGPSC